MYTCQSICKHLPTVYIQITHTNNTASFRPFRPVDKALMAGPFASQQLGMNEVSKICRPWCRLIRPIPHLALGSNINPRFMSTLIDCGGSPNSNWLLKWYPPQINSLGSRVD